MGEAPRGMQKPGDGIFPPPGDRCRKRLFLEWALQALSPQASRFLKARVMSRPAMSSAAAMKSA